MKKKHINIKENAKDILIKISMITFPILLGINFFIDAAYDYEIRNSKQHILSDFSRKIDIFEVSVQSLFQEVFEDIFVVENSDEFNRFVNNQNFETKLEVKELFNRYMKNKENYLQLRFLDKEGNEIIRADRINNDVLILPDQMLQSKKDRYYFKKTMNINKNNIYISDFDLNIEHGKIVKPYIPIIRFSTPVVDKNDNLIGILIINYNGQKFLDIFQRSFKDVRGLIDTSLTDNDGYYLYNKDPDKIFGFMFGGESLNHNIKIEHPSLWKLISSYKENSIDIQNTVFFFKKILPEFKEVVRIDNENFYWNVLVSLKKKDIPLIYPDKFLFKDNIKIYILLLVQLVFSTLIVILHFKKKESLQLQVSRLILQNVDEAVLIMDSKKNIIDLNIEACKLTGYSKQEILNLNTALLKKSVTSFNVYQKMKEYILAGQNWNGELWLKKKDGSKFAALLNVTHIKNFKSKKTDFFIFIVKDLSFRKKKEAEINYLLTHHSKTKLPNKELFCQLIDEEIKNDSEFSIISIKIKNYENFQLKYNDRYKDLINKEIIEIIKSVTKEKESISHLASDTFIVISKLSKDRISVNRLMSQLSNKLKSNMALNDKNITLEFDFGAVIFPDHGKTSEELLKKSILSISALKYYPGHNSIIFHKELEDKVQREICIEEQLISAIKNKEFEIYFQPQIDSKINKLIGLESLIRWNNPILGRVSPGEFIPIAEEIGIIDKIGMWVVEEVARLTKLLKLNEYREIKISINLSAEEFKNTFLVEDITYIFDIFNLDPSQFEIELTEGVLVNNYEYVKSKIDEFQVNGISVALDDFGTGFSSLSYLKRLKFDKIKIDRAFIKDYPESDNGEIAEFITHLAKKLDVNVIAEGVETEEQIKFLQSIGCNDIQGYYYSKPLSSEELAEYIQNYYAKNNQKNYRDSYEKVM